MILKKHTIAIGLFSFALFIVGCTSSDQSLPEVAGIDKVGPDLTTEDAAKEINDIIKKSNNSQVYEFTSEDLAFLKSEQLVGNVDLKQWVK